MAKTYAVYVTPQRCACITNRKNHIKYLRVSYFDFSSTGNAENKFVARPCNTLSVPKCDPFSGAANEQKR